MDKTLDVWWCEEHQATQFTGCCPNATVIGFVTYVEVNSE